VEVKIPGEEIQELSGSLVDKVDACFSNNKPVLLKTCQPIAAALC